VSSSWNRATKNQKAFNVRRFDCPAFLLAAEETGQTNRLSIEPIRQGSQRPFPKSRDSTIVPSAPISETAVHCANLHTIWHVQPNVNGGGFLKLKTGTFWIDTIPLMESRLAVGLVKWLALREARHEAVHATTHVASGEAPDEASRCLPGNCCAVSEQLPETSHATTDECPRNGWLNGW
jgi:hypothetical protein